MAKRQLFQQAACCVFCATWQTDRRPKPGSPEGWRASRQLDLLMASQLATKDLLDSGRAPCYLPHLRPFAIYFSCSVEKVQKMARVGS
jgi:hypothetical protein